MFPSTGRNIINLLRNRWICISRPNLAANVYSTLSSNPTISKSFIKRQSKLTNGRFGASSLMCCDRTPAYCTVVNFATNTRDPTQTNESKSNLIVVLDMDECLIHSEFFHDSAIDYRQYESAREGHNGKIESHPNSSCESFQLTLSGGDKVHVNKRPHLDFFLRQISSRYETYIFTAAMEEYASPVLDTLDPEGEMFRQRFYRQHCTYDKSLGMYVKDLGNAFKQATPFFHENLNESFEKIRKEELDKDEIEIEKPFNPKRIVLVDNNPYSFLANPSNGILVTNFYDDPEDNILRVVMELLHELDFADDVRPLLDTKFGMKNALKEMSKAYYQ